MESPDYPKSKPREPQHYYIVQFQGPTSGDSNERFHWNFLTTPQLSNFLFQTNMSKPDFSR